MSCDQIVIFEYTDHLSSSMGSGLSSMGSGYMVLILLCVERVHCIHVVRRMIH